VAQGEQKKHLQSILAAGLLAIAASTGIAHADSDWILMDPASGKCVSAAGLARRAPSFATPTALRDTLKSKSLFGETLGYPSSDNSGLLVAVEVVNKNGMGIMFFATVDLCQAGSAVAKGFNKGTLKY
jgi:hypothetical protein